MFVHLEVTMSLEETKAIVRRHLIDVLEQGHVELIDGYYAPDGSIPDMDTPQQLKDRILAHHKFAPGYKITILDMIAEGDKVVVFWQAEVTYSVIPDPPPSFPFYPYGRPVSFTVMTLYRIVDGKLVSMVEPNDWIGMLVKEGLYVPGKLEPAHAYKAAGADK
jgi:predicted ester cyclase